MYKEMEIFIGDFWSMYPTKFSGIFSPLLFKKDYVYYNREKVWKETSYIS